MIRKFVSTILLSVLIYLPVVAQTSAKSMTLIKAGRLIDVRNGRALTDQAILVEGDRIKEVGPATQLASRSAGARVIDLCAQNQERLAIHHQSIPAVLFYETRRFGAGNGGRIATENDREES